MAAGAWYGAGGMESIELNSTRAGGSFGTPEITQQRGAEALLIGGVLGQQECAGWDLPEITDAQVAERGTNSSMASRIATPGLDLCVILLQPFRRT